jgi:hypothetical protein
MLAALRALALDAASVPAPELKPGDSWVFDRSVQRGASGFSDQLLDIKVESVGADTLTVGIKMDSAPGDLEAQRIGADWSQRRLISEERTTTARLSLFP